VWESKITMRVVRSIAWALEHPGCFAYGSDEKEAIANLPAAIQAYSVWIGRHESLWLDETNVELKVEESFTAYCINEAFERVVHSDDEVNAWFQHDWKPLTARDVEHGLELLSWTRSDLLDTIAGLSDEQLDQNISMNVGASMVSSDTSAARNGGT